MAYADEVRKSLHGMDTEEIEQRVASDVLTDEARKIALRELSQRGVTQFDMKGLANGGIDGVKLSVEEAQKRDSQTMSVLGIVLRIVLRLLSRH